jgi:hypothetical protein
VSAGPPYVPKPQKSVPAVMPTADPNPPKPHMDRTPFPAPGRPLSDGPTRPVDPEPSQPTAAPAVTQVMVEPQQVFGQIKAVKAAIAACGGEDNLKKMIELMKEHGI